MNEDSGRDDEPRWRFRVNEHGRIERLAPFREEPWTWRDTAIALFGLAWMLVWFILWQTR